MSAVERALERGRKAAATRGKATVEPVDVRYRGRLLAYVSRNGGEPEAVHIIGGAPLFYALAQDKDGRTYAPAVRDAPTKRVVRAMIEPDDEEEFYELIRETHARYKAELEAASEGAEQKLVKRGAES